MKQIELFVCKNNAFGKTNLQELSTQRVPQRLKYQTKTDNFKCIFLVYGALKWTVENEHFFVVVFPLAQQKHQQSVSIF